jgi:ribonuclease Z
LLGRKQTLNIYCPPDLKELIERLHDIGETRLNYRINWVFTGNTGLQKLFEDSKVEVFSFPLRHRIFCTGFLLREKPLPRKIDRSLLDQHRISVADIGLLRTGHDVMNADGELVKNAAVTLDPPPPRTYAYCSDTVFDSSIVVYIKNADLLYHESTFLNDQLERAKKTFHSTAGQAAEIAQLSGARQLLLGHFSARYRELNDFLTEAAPFFKNCVLATDGKVIEI